MWEGADFLSGLLCLLEVAATVRMGLHIWRGLCEALAPGCLRSCRSHTGGTGATRLGTAFLGSLCPSLQYSGDFRGFFHLCTANLLATPALPSPELQTLHSSGSPESPLSQNQLKKLKKHPSTCLPAGPLSCRLNICLMAISCLNMSWAKPLCEHPENKWLPAGTTAMPPLQSISYGCLICFPSLLCLQPAHLLSRSEDFTPSSENHRKSSVLLPFSTLLHVSRISQSTPLPPILHVYSQPANTTRFRICQCMSVQHFLISLTKLK